MSELKIRDFAAEAAGDNEDFLDFSNKGEGTEDTPSGEENIKDEDKGAEIDLTLPPTPEEKIGDDELPKDSSVTPEPPQIADLPEQKEVEITDELALKYLNEKLGMEIKSFEELGKPTSENPLDKDPYLKALYEWREKTGRPIEDWAKYQKDYSSLSELDVARELLKSDYPSFTDEEIELELDRYIPDELDTEREIALKNLELKKLATRGREVLAKLKSDLELPAETLAPEIKENLDFAEFMKKEAVVEKEKARDYNEGISKASVQSESFELALDDDLKVNFKIPEQGKKELPDLIQNMPHWYNEDGTWNHKAVVDDAIKIKYFNDMVKLAYEQGVNSGAEKVVTDTKNTNFNVDPAGKQQDGKKGVVIEDLDDYLGERGVKMRFK